MFFFLGSFTSFKYFFVKSASNPIGITVCFLDFRKFGFDLANTFKSNFCIPRDFLICDFLRLKAVCHSLIHCHFHKIFNCSRKKAYFISSGRAEPSPVLKALNLYSLKTFLDLKDDHALLQVL